MTNYQKNLKTHLNYLNSITPINSVILSDEYKKDYTIGIIYSINSDEYNQNV